MPHTSGSIRLCATIVSNSFPCTEIPCHFKMLTSNLRLWPDLFQCLDFQTTRRNSSNTYLRASSYGIHRHKTPHVIPSVRRE